MRIRKIKPYEMKGEIIMLNNPSDFMDHVVICQGFRPTCVIRVVCMLWRSSKGQILEKQHFDLE